MRGWDWSQGLRCGHLAPFVQQGQIKSAPTGCFGALLLNLSKTRAIPLHGWLGIPTGPGWLYSEVKIRSSFLKVLLNIAKAFMVPILASF